MTFTVGDRVEWQDVARNRALQAAAPWNRSGEVVKVLAFSKMLKVRLADGFVVSVRTARVRKAEVNI